MSEESHIHHRIDYIEFAVTDMKQSKKFFSEAFGWEFNDYGPTYAGIKSEHGEAGGLSLESTVSTGGPLVILYSKDLDLTLNKIKQVGGQIAKQPYDFPGGRRFHFTDPSGNELAVWSDQ